MSEDRELPAETAEEPVDDGAAARRTDQQAMWVEIQLRGAVERGDFDNLPGAGKPIRGLDGKHDPDWWVKALIERENLSGLAPPALGLRKDDAELNDQLDRQSSESEVRRMLTDFNARVLHARRQLNGGPPVITQPRDVDVEVGAWRERRAARAQEHSARVRKDEVVEQPSKSRRRWWRRSQTL